jgi:hypothetical protein
MLLNSADLPATDLVEQIRGSFPLLILATGDRVEHSQASTLQVMTIWRS